jgi:uncharacterized phage protein (TIGR01671 family)
MNREIKFRIWADNKFYNKCLVGNTNNTNDEKWTCPMVWLEKQKEWVHCDNGIICQYTGLHDKNGKEIYEGDIVEITRPCILERGEVKFINGCFAIKSKDTLLMLYQCEINNFKLKVIGNIYDNPELLGGENG